MPTKRQKRRAPVRKLPTPPEDLVRETEEHLALAKELIELARELCLAAWELRKITQPGYISRTTEH